MFNYVFSRFNNINSGVAQRLRTKSSKLKPEFESHDKLPAKILQCFSERIYFIYLYSNSLISYKYFFKNKNKNKNKLFSIALAYGFFNYS